MGSIYNLRIDDTKEFDALINENDAKCLAFYDCYFNRIDFYKLFSLIDTNLVDIRFYDCDFRYCEFHSIENRSTAIDDIVFYNCIFANCNIRTIAAIVTLYNCRIYCSHIFYWNSAWDTGIFDTTFQLHCVLENVTIQRAPNTVFNDVVFEPTCEIKNCDFRYAYTNNLFISQGTIIKNTMHPYFDKSLPADEFIGWKIVSLASPITHYPYDPCYICKLLIPKDAKRIKTINGKCRCDKAIVLAMYDVGSNEECKTAFGKSRYINEHDEHCILYAPGKTVYADSFDENPLVECSNGIHFFLTREEAERY